MRQGLGSGTLFLTGASFAFLISGYLIHVGLARYLGAELYGIFGVLMSLYVINRSLLNTGIPIAMSKFLADATNDPREVTKTAFFLQLFASTFFALVYIMFAPQIAFLLKDPGLQGFIRFLGILVIPLALLYLYFGGYLNGLRRFREEALLKSFFAFSRVFFTFIFIFLGLGVLGALLGYFFAGLAALLVGFFWFKGESFVTARFFPWRKIAFFAIPLALTSSGLVVMRNVSVLLIKAMLQDNKAVGFYTAALTISDAPYILFSALPLALLPVISRALSEGDEKTAKTQIQNSLRYLSLFLFPSIALLAGSSRELLGLIYSSEYLPAADALVIQLFSSLFLVLFLTFVSLIAAAGKPKVNVLITLGGITLLAGLGVLLIPQRGIVGAAIASVTASFFSFLLAFFWVSRKFGNVLQWFSLLKVLLLSAALFVLASSWVTSGIFFVGEALVLGLLYLLLLFLFGELTQENVKMIRRHFLRKKGEEKD